MTAKELIEIARKEIGYQEGPNNDTKFGKEYGMNHVSWCMIFIWCIFKAGGVADKIHKTASVKELEAWATKKGYIVPVTEIRPGDIVTFTFDHVELATSYINQKSKLFHSIGGNTSSGDKGSQANGDGVYEKLRPINLVRNVVRIPL